MILDAQKNKTRDLANDMKHLRKDGGIISISNLDLEIKNSGQFRSHRPICKVEQMR